MTALSVPNTSNRGCPSSLAGTTCPRDRSRISATVLKCTIGCRTDRSGRLRRCVTPPRHPRLPATVPAYSRPATTSHTRTPKTAQHAATCPTEPSPGLPIGDKRPFPLLTVSAPNSSRKYNSLQNRRERRQPHARPFRCSRRGDRSAITLPPSQSASASLAAMWLQCGCLADLHFCNSPGIRGTCPDQTLLAHLPTTPRFPAIAGWKHPRFTFLQLTPIPVHPQDIKTGFLRRSRRPQAAPATASTSAPGPLAAMSPGLILAISPLTAGLPLRDDRE